jgi:hypothetical protein
MDSEINIEGFYIRGSFMGSVGRLIRISLSTSMIFLFVGCASDEVASHYASISPEDDIAAYAAQKNGSAEALDELGWSSSRKLSPDEEEVLNKRLRLKRLESKLTDMRERDQYFKYKPHLDGDDDCIYFLSLDGMDARDRYAMQKGIYFRANRYAPAVRDAISRSDIILGMGKDAVVEAWGEPATVEVAGVEAYGNERWAYVDYVETPEGYQRQERIVFFEAGKVAGWQKH